MKFYANIQYLVIVPLDTDCVHGGRVAKALAYSAQGDGFGGISEIYLSKRYSVRHRGTWNGMCDIAGINCDL